VQPAGVLDDGEVSSRLRDRQTASVRGSVWKLSTHDRAREVAKCRFGGAALAVALLSGFTRARKCQSALGFATD
jgi:hypothetical protein